MGKAKKANPKKHLSHPYNNKKQSSSKGAPVRAQFKQHTKHVSKSSAAKPQSQQRQGLPFGVEDRILLVGEGICIPISPKLPDALPTGDFSFARSLQSYHRCSSLTATSVETRASLLSKYPQAASNIASLEAASHQVLYSIDATKLGRPHAPGASSLRNSRYNVIIFNFPHVGGKSTDVNRQVRLNQELVVKFLEHARGLLVESGKVLLTVFEGQPYELWGVRNLARHAGLRVDRSMNFDAELYPGYKHVRTLGNIEGGGGWKGEDRSARMFIFVHGNAHRVLGSKQADGRSRGEDEYEDGDEDDQYHSETTA